jgi:hypothetical protein
MDILRLYNSRRDFMKGVGDIHYIAENIHPDQTVSAARERGRGLTMMAYIIGEVTLVPLGVTNLQSAWRRFRVYRNWREPLESYRTSEKDAKRQEWEEEWGRLMDGKDSKHPK